jgi:hypothetical protein
VYHLPVSDTVRESSWLFPTLEWMHIYSMIFLISVIAALDLRLLGLKIDYQPSRQSVSQLSRRVLRWAWGAFGVNAATGAFLFASKAPDYYINSAFRVKVVLLLVGLTYHWAFLPVVARWEDAAAMPVGSKLAGGFSLLLWIGVITASRWIAYM